MTVKSFEDLGLQKWLDKQCTAMAMTRPTPVQASCIPAVLKGDHVCGGAATGSGKTAAFVLPLLQELTKEIYGVFALVLSPSRELAYQILDQFVAFGAPIGARTAIIIGGVPHAKQIDTLLGRPHIVIATPGRLKFLFETFPEVIKAFLYLRFLVLDEADRLTEGDISDDTLEVVKLLGPPRPQRRTLLFTATVTENLMSDGVLAHLGIPGGKSGLTMCCCDTAMKEFALAPRITHQYVFVPVVVKLPYLVSLLQSRAPGKSAIVFANSCFRCEIVRLTLQLLGFPVCSLNSLLTQQQRLNNLALFKSGITRVLIATDIASRGLDIPDVDLVIHYDFPKLPCTYVHRVGRSARTAELFGLSIAFVTQHDVNLVHKIERKTKQKLSLLKDRAVTDEAVVKILDEVSAAKVQARVQITEQYGDRASILKAIAAERRPEINREIRNGGAFKPKTFHSATNIGGGERSNPVRARETVEADTPTAASEARPAKKTRTEAAPVSAEAKPAKKLAAKGAAVTKSKVKQMRVKSE